jgi:hypothetical protein
MQLTKSLSCPINHVILTVIIVVLITITTAAPVINGQLVVERQDDDYKTIDGEQFGNGEDGIVCGSDVR